MGSLQVQDDESGVRDLFGGDEVFSTKGPDSIILTYIVIVFRLATISTKHSCLSEDSQSSHES